MKKEIYTCTKFTGHWPVGAAAVVTAASQEKAAWILNSELQLRGLKGDAKPEDMMPYPAGDPCECRILVDGDY